MGALGDIETLVLSSGYEPMARVSWQRAMGMWVSGRVEMVEHYQDVAVRTVSASFPLPAIVRFAHAGAWRRVFLRFSRENVYVRDEGTCQYCVQPVSRARATWDHVIPSSRGGRTAWDNVVLACKTCNQRKGNRTPEEAGMPLKSRPRKPQHLSLSSESAMAFRHGMPDSWLPYLKG